MSFERIKNRAPGKVVFVDADNELDSKSTTGTNDVVLNDSPTFTGTINAAAMSMSAYLTLVGDPTNALHATTKQYVDAMVTGLDVKKSVKAATTANITLSGEQTIDGVALVSGDRVLVKDQTTGSQNGIYVVSTGSWTRSEDADNSPAGEVTAGMFTFVEQGSTYSDQGYVMTTNDPITLGTTSLAFAQFSGTGSLVAGNGLTQTGNIFDVVTADSGRIVVDADSIDLAMTGISAGTYTKLTIDVYGRATASSSLSSSDITTALTYTPVNKAGDTMTGFLTLSADPTSGLHAATKQYVDSLVTATASSTTFKTPVRIATTANITLSGLQTIDGVLTLSGDRVLVKDQTTGLDNGIYVASSGSWTRSTDADSSAEVIAGLFVIVTEGTTYADKAFVLTTDDPIVLGVTSLSFAQMSGGGGSVTIANVGGFAGVFRDESPAGTFNLRTLQGTTNRITATQNADDVAFDISSSYVGQASITTLGTITSGVWNGTTVAIANGGTGQTTATAAFNALSPMTTLGDTIYGGASGAGTRLAGNTTTTRKFLRQTGDGSISAAPAWDTVTKTDVGLSNVENTALSTWAGSTNLVTLGTVATGVWQGTSIDTAYTDAKIKTVTGTTSRLTIGGTATDPTFDISTAYVGQATITTLGTVSTGTWSATTISIAKGGTGQTTAAAAFDALSPMTTLGDTIYGGTSGTGTRLAGNTTTTLKVLSQTGDGSASAAPVWLTSTGTGNAVLSASPILTGTIDAAAMTLSSTLSVTSTITNTALSASQAVFTDGSKNLVSNAITGSGNVVMSASPTLTGTIGAAALTLSTTLGVTGVATFTAQPIMSSLTALLPVFTDASKGLVSNTMTGTGNVVMSASPTFTGTIIAASISLSGTTTLSADPVSALQAATKQYVDATATGLTVKKSVRVATTANISISSAPASIDGVTLASGNRVLVKNQTTGTENGIYDFNGAGSALTRSSDADNTPAGEVVSGMFTFVTEGTVNANYGFSLITADPITLGTTSLSFSQFSGAGSFTAGSGLTQTGNQIDVVGTANRITANADSIDISATYVGQASITTLGTITTGTWNAGDVTISTLSASQAVFTDGSKKLVSNAITGTGNVVMSASPTLTGTIGAAAMTLSSTLAVTGPIGAGGASSADTGIYVHNSALAGINQYGIYCNPTVASDATTSGTAILAKLSTAVASFTVTAGYGVRISDASKGAGSTITTQYGLRIDNQTQGSTNYAINTGLGLVSFGDAVTCTSTLAVTGKSTLTAAVGIGVAPGTQASLEIQNAGSTGVTQYGLINQVLFGTGATNAGITNYLQFRASGAFTMATGRCIYIAPPSITTATVTTSVALDIDNQTGGGTNYAIRTGTGQISFGDVVSMSSTLSVTSEITASSGILFATGGGGQGRMYRSSVDGIIVRAVAGSTNDYALISAAGNILLANPTGTGNLTVGYASGTTTIPGAASLSSTLAVTGTSTFTGRLGIGAAPSASYGINVAAYTGITGASQYGLVIDAPFSSAATSSTIALYSHVTTAASITTTNAYSMYIESNSKGAGSTITTGYGLFVNNQSAGATNYAIYTGSGQVQFSDYVGIGIGGPANDVGLYITAVSNFTSGTTLSGVMSDVTFPATATSQVSALRARVRSTATSYTLSSGIGLKIEDATKGAGSTISTLYGLYVIDQTQGTTNYAIYTNAGAVRFGGAVTSASTITSTGDVTISNSTSGGPLLILNSTDTGGRQYTLASGGSANGAFPTGSFTIRDSTAGANRMTIDSAGLVAIVNAATVGTTLGVTGNTAMGGAVDTSVGLYVRHNQTLLTASEYGIVSTPTFGTAATTDGTAILAGLITTGSFTMINGYGIHVATAAKGAGTITTNYGLKIDDQTVGGTNYAIKTGKGFVQFGDIATLSSTTFSNANFTVPTPAAGTASSNYVGQTGTMSASRTVTLPAASTFPRGTMIIIADESGSVTATNTIVVTRAGSDTINGATTYTMTVAYGFAILMSDGSSKWTRISSTVN